MKTIAIGVGIWIFAVLLLAFDTAYSRHLKSYGLFASRIPEARLLGAIRLIAASAIVISGKVIYIGSIGLSVPGLLAFFLACALTLGTLSLVGLSRGVIHLNPPRFSAELLREFFKLPPANSIEHEYGVRLSVYYSGWAAIVGLLILLILGI